MASSQAMFYSKWKKVIEKKPMGNEKKSLDVEIIFFTVLRPGNKERVLIFVLETCHSWAGIYDTQQAMFYAKWKKKRFESNRQWEEFDWSRTNLFTELRSWNKGTGVNIFVGDMPSSTATRERLPVEAILQLRFRLSWGRSTCFVLQVEHKPAVSSYSVTTKCGWITYRVSDVLACVCGCRHA